MKYLGWHRADVMRDLIEQPRPSDDKLWDQTLAERDEYHDMADKLANAIADHLLVEIGEHSSSNCPWMRALEAIENAAPQASDAVRNQALEEAAQTAYKALFPTNDRSDWTEFAESASFNAKYAAQCIRALKSQSAALSAQPGAQKEQSDV
ncbi:hypothetical protein LMG26219_06339 [Achromobacter marplatensis]|nr:hypothetical protein LMG26219_06339 [Achromobacter marplatensis]